MSATGIGAPVRRKEDQRFITGKGQYTDDINRPGQTYAVFVRSPHAHANIKRIDTSAALKSPGCVAVYTGAEIAADKVGGLICGWMIHSKDGSPMKAGAHPALAQGKVRLVGDHVPSSSARLWPRPRMRPNASLSIRDLPPSSISPPPRTQPGRSLPRRPQHRLPMAPRRQGGRRCAFGKRPARHQDRSRQQSPDPQCHRAATPLSATTTPAGSSRSTPPARTRTWRASCFSAFIASRPSTSCA